MRARLRDRDRSRLNAGGSIFGRIGRRKFTPQDLTSPTIVFIGGATGTGKSTVATEIAHHLGITRVSSTDLIRETMRALFSPEFMPSIHYSSFEAAHAVDTGFEEDRLVGGFLAQCSRVSVGIGAAVARAVTERWSMIVEGVHVLPGVVRTDYEGAVVVPVVLEMPDPELHRRCFHVRDAETGALRPVDKYVRHLDEIRRIQNFVVSRARRDGFAVIQNTGIRSAVDQVVDLVVDVSARHLRLPAAQRPQIQP